MNGFAAEGFSKGLLSGLEASNTLADASHKRRLEDATAEYLKKRSDASSLRDEMEAQKTANEMRQKQRAEMLPQLMPIAESISRGEPVTEDQIKMLNDTGINLKAIADDGAVDRLKDTVELVRQKKIDMNHPMVGEVLNDFLGHKVQRGIGGISVDPNTNTPIRVDKKEIIGLSPHPQDPSLFGVNVRVTGKDENGNVHSYDDMASKHGTSHPEDSYLFFNPSQIEAPLAGALALNAGLRRNPENRQRIARVINDSIIDPETQAKIALRNSQIDTESAQQRAYGSLADLRDANKEYVRTERPKTDAAERNKLEAQAGSYDRANTPQSGSLGSAKSTPKPKDFDESLASKQASRFIPAPRDQYDGKEKTTDEVMQKRNAHIATIRDLMRVGGVDNQNDAARFAEQGQPIEMKTKDGRRFKGVRVVVDGKPMNIPTQWLN